jgi:uncharacterized protein YacL
MALLYIILGLVFLETSFLVFRSFKGTKIGTGTKRKIYVDTSALMDGRILSIARTGFIGDDLIIPRSAIRELQLLADGKDSEKRMRARLGMETANELERVVFCNTEILEDALDRTPVDERLIQLAKENHGLIFTCDFNLQKVAETEKIEVLNPNELAAGLRSEFVPGDKFKLKISAEGQNPKQGVGYLPEGTMVVVESASSDIGKEVEVEFEKYIQTNSGRMMFAKKATKHVRKVSKPRKDQHQTRGRSRNSHR